MKQAVSALVNKYYGKIPKTISPLGGGFYGRVFLAEIDKAPYNIVVKRYLFPNLAEKEAAQLKILAAHASVKMPDVYHIASDEAILMEYIPGINAGNLNLTLSENNRQQIAEEMIVNLLKYHSAINKRGFGEIEASAFEPSWEKYYKRKADIILKKAEAMYTDGKINEDVISVMRNACHLYGKLFYVPVTSARLIHGDYNTWNILLNEDLTHVKAVIDPFNCSWADSEFDLYQLNNANGKYYGLLDIYSAKTPLSENFALKMCFYELFSEVAHYYDAGIDTKHSQIPAEAEALRRQIKLLGI